MKAHEVLHQLERWHETPHNGGSRAWIFVSEVRVGTGFYTHIEDYTVDKAIRNATEQRIDAFHEYVRGDVHTNGIESLWSIFKRGYVGTYHQMSEAHLSRYVNEFTGRHNIRPLGTVEQMGSVAVGMVGKRLRYDDLITA